MKINPIVSAYISQISSILFWIIIILGVYLKWNITASWYLAYIPCIMATLAHIELYFIPITPSNIKHFNIILPLWLINIVCYYYHERIVPLSKCDTHITGYCILINIGYSFLSAFIFCTGVYFGAILPKLAVKNREIRNGYKKAKDFIK